MTPTDRREFIQGAAVGAMSLPWVQQVSAAQEASSDRVPIALIGVGGMGSNHLRLLARRPDVQIIAVCDVDQQRLATARQEVEMAGQPAPRAVTDLRQVLDDQAIAAVFIATPDHWHAPAAILALDAGKHVYVEKPCCQNLREGVWMEAAVARSGKQLQVGTQSRSTGFVREAMERLQAGAIGEILVAKAWNSQRRGTIGKSQPSDPPAHLDFDLWLGPARVVPYRANLLHGVWRWWYDFGCGDIGNDGVHDIDVALWGLGVDRHPSTVACLGGKYFFDDDQQFPDTQYVVCEYSAEAPGQRARQLIFEQRIWSPYVQEGYENGAAFYGTQGLMIVGHSVGWKLYGPRNELREERTGSGDLAAHHTNFLEAVRGQAASTNAPIQVGLRAATVVHLANIAARRRRVVEFDGTTMQITNDVEGQAMTQRAYREHHWAAPRG